MKELLLKKRSLLGWIGFVLAALVFCLASTVFWYLGLGAVMAILLTLLKFSLNIDISVSEAFPYLVTLALIVGPLFVYLEYKEHLAKPPATPETAD